jgi:RNA polymerase sigma-70 factor (ECF subfamily)
MSWDEINTLVLKAQQGDRAAYGELFERFQGAVYAMALERVRNPAEAQELAQEVFIHAMKKLPQLREPRCFAGWLRRITARMAINRLSRNARVSGVDAEMLDQVEGRSAAPSAAIEFAETHVELHEGLKRLKALDRATLEAFYLRGQSLQQMSREFSTPVGTIKRRLHVARLRLKEVLIEGNWSGAA